MLESKTQQPSFNILRQKFEEDHHHLEQRFVEREWNVRPSEFSLNTTNPIRAIIENLDIEPNPEKQFIPLSVGKLCAFENISIKDMSAYTVDEELTILDDAIL